MAPSSPVPGWSGRNSVALSFATSSPSCRLTCSRRFSRASTANSWTHVDRADTGAAQGSAGLLRYLRARVQLQPQPRGRGPAPETWEDPNDPERLPTMVALKRTENFLDAATFVQRLLVRLVEQMRRSTPTKAWCVRLSASRTAKCSCWTNPVSRGSRLSSTRCLKCCSSSIRTRRTSSIRCVPCRLWLARSSLEKTCPLPGLACETRTCRRSLAFPTLCSATTVASSAALAPRKVH